MKLASILTTATLGLALLLPTEAEARKVHGATIPDGVEPLSETAKGGAAHFRVLRPWTKTMRELERTYRRVPGVVIRRVDSPPRVRAWYIENTRAGRSWDGINLYEDLAKKTIFLSVLPAKRP